MDYTIIDVIKQPRKSGGMQTILIVKCTNNYCSNFVKVRKGGLERWSGFCKQCNNRKKPYESLYNIFVKSAIRYWPVEITYEDFLNYTKIDKCHYCYSKINWIPYSTVNGSFLSNSYYLDRKNSFLGYTIDNLVVCCTRCNRGKSNAFSYDEWYKMTECFRI